MTASTRCRLGDEEVKVLLAAYRSPSRATTFGRRIVRLRLARMGYLVSPRPPLVGWWLTDAGAHALRLAYVTVGDVRREMLFGVTTSTRMM